MKNFVLKILWFSDISMTQKTNNFNGKENFGWRVALLEGLQQIDKPV
jgi:hypothetical protein